MGPFLILLCSRDTQKAASSECLLNKASLERNELTRLEHRTGRAADLVPAGLGCSCRDIRVFIFRHLQKQAAEFPAQRKHRHRFLFTLSLDLLRLSPGGRGWSRSCRRWVVPPAWRRPRFHRWAARCRWSRRCRAPAARPLRCGWSRGSPSGKSSRRSRCSTGTAPRGPPRWSACRWRSSPDGWCGTWAVRRWCRRPYLHRKIEMNI